MRAIECGSLLKQTSPDVGVQLRTPSSEEFFTAALDWCPLLRVDSEVVDLVFAMEDMERGLQEMAQSVEHMQEMLKRSPMVQALAQRKPEVRAPSALLSHNGRRGLHRVRGQVQVMHAPGCSFYRMMAVNVLPLKNSTIL